MIYPQLFDRMSANGIVSAGVIGTGDYATAIVTQSAAISRLAVPVIADIDLAAARKAYLLAGTPEEDIVVCQTRGDALDAIERSHSAIVQDALLLMDLPIDVIVESTGVPEAGARHAREAIHHGKHVAMVSKETDVVVGPILKHLADQAGVVYSAVEGDQHGLLMGLVSWARELGLEVLCGGKFRNGEIVYDPHTRGLRSGGRLLQLADEQMAYFQPIPPNHTTEYASARREMLGDLAEARGSDLVEMAIAANGTGLLPDTEELHCPVLRTAEIPEALCPKEEGGILGRRGTIEVVTCLRAPTEAGLGGGVYIVVACDNDYSRHIITTKGLIPNSRGTAALIYRPYHLCGVETPVTLLAAALLDVPTGARELLPRVDVVARALTDLRPGARAGGDHGPDLKALIHPARPVAPDTPLPLHMANGNVIGTDIPSGSLITAARVVSPTDSALWALRAQQDALFLQP